jgi:hypothetical protein
MFGHNHNSSTVGAEIARKRVVAKQAHLEKGWPMTLDRAADLLADLVFVMLMLLLFVWVGLWTLVH